MHWFVVASQVEVRIFRRLVDESGKIELKLMKILSHSLGRERRRALIRKEAGEGIKTMGRVGFVRYSKLKRHDPHKVTALDFAREIARYLQVEHLKGNFRNLTIAAEPGFLGMIKAEMKKDLKSSVLTWIRKDLQRISKMDLISFLLPKSSPSATVTG